jgi:hypothetical protein
MDTENPVAPAVPPVPVPESAEWGHVAPAATRELTPVAATTAAGTTAIPAALQDHALVVARIV